MRFALVAALLVACGNDSAGRIDAGGDDDGDGGGDDDAMIDADPNVRGPVSVRIVDKNDVPLAGMYVVFIDRDATVTEKMTDAAGMAQLDVYPNATVTAVRTRGMAYSLVTVLALNPGDVITLISAASNVTSSEDPFSNRVVPMPGANIETTANGGATKSGTTGTFKTIGPHGLAVGDGVVISSVQQSGYNGSYIVAAVPDATTFTVTMGGGGLPASGTGNVGATAMKATPFTISYPAMAGATSYEVHTSCGTLDVGTATSMQVMLPVGCARNPMDVAVLARQGTGFSWTQQANVAVTAGGSTTISDTWHARSTLVATYTNPSPTDTGLSFAHFAPYLRGIPDAETTGTATGTTMLMFDASAPGRAVVSTQISCPSTVAGCLSTPMGAAAQRITQTSAAATYALDLGANQLPWVKANYVPATTTLDITTMGTGAFDIFEGNLRYTRGQFIYTWRVFGPLAQSVTFPTLPASAPGNPTVLTSDIMSSYQAFIGESDAISGYRDAIKNPFTALGACEASANIGLLPGAGGKNRISQWN